MVDPLFRREWCSTLKGLISGWTTLICLFSGTHYIQPDQEESFCRTLFLLSLPFFIFSSGIQTTLFNGSVIHVRKQRPCHTNHLFQPFTGSYFTFCSIPFQLRSPDSEIRNSSAAYSSHVIYLIKYSAYQYKLNERSPSEQDSKRRVSGTIMHYSGNIDCINIRFSSPQSRENRVLSFGSSLFTDYNGI